MKYAKKMLQLAYLLLCFFSAIGVLIYCYKKGTQIITQLEQANEEIQIITQLVQVNEEMQTITQLEQVNEE